VTQKIRQAVLTLLTAAPVRPWPNGGLPMADGKFNLKAIRSQLITAATIVVALRVVLWSIEPFFPYIISGIILATAIGVVLYRTIR
jgi:hypothetical protein